MGFESFPNAKLIVLVTTNGEKQKNIKVEACVPCENVNFPIIILSVCFRGDKMY